MYDCGCFKKSKMENKNPHWIHCIPCTLRYAIFSCRSALSNQNTAGHISFSPRMSVCSTDRVPRLTYCVNMVAVFISPTGNWLSSAVIDCRWLSGCYWLSFFGDYRRLSVFTGVNWWSSAVIGVYPLSLTLIGCHRRLSAVIGCH